MHSKSYANNFNLMFLLILAAVGALLAAFVREQLFRKRFGHFDTERDLSDDEREQMESVCAHR